MIEGRITSKAQTIIPRAVRTTLSLREGDRLAYHIEGNRVVLVRARPNNEAADPLAMFTEWSDELDAAYDAL